LRPVPEDTASGSRRRLTATRSTDAAVNATNVDRHPMATPNAVPAGTPNRTAAVPPAVTMVTARPTRSGETIFPA
jgi:hypothetical protein